MVTKRPARSLAAAGAGAVVSAALLAAGCPAAPPAPPPPPPAAGGAPAPATAPKLLPFIIAAPVDDRLVPDPCSRIPGGGLLSLPHVYGSLSDRTGLAVGVLLGDMTHAPGDMGRYLAEGHYSNLVADAATGVVAAGPGDLALGVDFARQALATKRYSINCANAVDANGKLVLKPFSLVEVEKRHAILVATVDPSLQPELDAAGSDVRIAPPRPLLEEKLAEARAEAARRERHVSATVVLHHGTVEQTAALVQGLEGVSFAVATRGGDLPDTDPYVVPGSAPVFYPGRGLAFAWVTAVDEGKLVRWRLERIGAALLSRSAPDDLKPLQDDARAFRDGVFPSQTGVMPDRGDLRPADPRGRYAGSAACARCHAEQVAAHGASAHAKLPERLQPEDLGRVRCLVCHVTGALTLGGWRGAGDSSDLAGVSCEACHGPGSAHVEDEGKTPGYGAFDLANCRRCHTPDRAPDFDAKTLWETWGHGSPR